MSVVIQGYGVASTQSSLQLVVGPTIEPFEVHELQAHLRIDTAEASEDLARKITAARRWVERATGRALLSQQWAYWFDAFPACGYVEIPTGPILSIDSLVSYDALNVETVYAGSNYQTDVALGRVLLNRDAVWPSDRRSYRGGKVLFTAGYGTDPMLIPPDLREAVAMMTGYFYNDRDGFGPPPEQARAIVESYALVML